ncbi:MAG: ATP-binding protein [Anaerolineae bacterium]
MEKKGSTHADPAQIEQVLVNLVVNARDAMPGGGTLTIETSNVTLDDVYVRSHPGAVQGDYVLIAVTDTGVGMTDEVKSRIFEPFFTTKEPGKGTGLGLSTVFGIVKQHEGNIYVYSEPGVGTTFKVYLRQVAEAAQPLPAQAEEEHLVGGSETVLVTEDDAAVRRMAARILRGLGYTVLEAANGAEALQAARKYGGRIDLLITDVVMPRMNGRELAQRLAEICPGVKVLYVSGYTENAIAHNHILDEGARFLQKPFARRALARKVREALEA